MFDHFSFEHDQSSTTTRSDRVVSDPVPLPRENNVIGLGVEEKDQTFSQSLPLATKPKSDSTNNTINAKGKKPLQLDPINPTLSVNSHRHQSSESSAESPLKTVGSVTPLSRSNSVHSRVSMSSVSGSNMFQRTSQPQSSASSFTAKSQAQTQSSQSQTHTHKRSSSKSSLHDVVTTPKSFFKYFTNKTKQGTLSSTTASTTSSHGYSHSQSSDSSQGVSPIFSKYDSSSPKFQHRRTHTSTSLTEGIQESDTTADTQAHTVTAPTSKRSSVYTTISSPLFAPPSSQITTGSTSASASANNSAACTPTSSSIPPLSRFTANATSGMGRPLSTISVSTTASTANTVSSSISTPNYTNSSSSSSYNEGSSNTPGKVRSFVKLGSKSIQYSRANRSRKTSSTPSMTGSLNSNSTLMEEWDDASAKGSFEKIGPVGRGPSPPGQTIPVVTTSNLHSTVPMASSSVTPQQQQQQLISPVTQLSIPGTITNAKNIDTASATGQGIVANTDVNAAPATGSGIGTDIRAGCDVDHAQIVSYNQSTASKRFSGNIKSNNNGFEFILKNPPPPQRQRVPDKVAGSPVLGNVTSTDDSPVPTSKGLPDASLDLKGINSKFLPKAARPKANVHILITTNFVDYKLIDISNITSMSRFSALVANTFKIRGDPAFYITEFGLSKDKLGKKLDKKVLQSIWESLNGLSKSITLIFYVNSDGKMKPMPATDSIVTGTGKFSASNKPNDLLLPPPSSQSLANAFQAHNMSHSPDAGSKDRNEETSLYTTSSYTNSINSDSSYDRYLPTPQHLISVRKDPSIDYWNVKDAIERRPSLTRARSITHSSISADGVIPMSSTSVSSLSRKTSKMSLSQPPPLSNTPSTPPSSSTATFGQTPPMATPTSKLKSSFKVIPPQKPHVDFDNKRSTPFTKSATSSLVAKRYPPPPPPTSISGTPPSVTTSPSAPAPASASSPSTSITNSNSNSNSTGSTASSTRANTTASAGSLQRSQTSLRKNHGPLKMTSNSIRSLQRSNTQNSIISALSSNSGGTHSSHSYPIDPFAENKISFRSFDDTDDSDDSTTGSKKNRDFSGKSNNEALGTNGNSTLCDSRASESDASFKSAQEKSFDDEDSDNVSDSDGDSDGDDGFGLFAKKPNGIGKANSTSKFGGKTPQSAANTSRDQSSSGDDDDEDDGTFDLFQKQPKGLNLKPKASTGSLSSNISSRNRNQNPNENHHGSNIVHSIGKANVLVARTHNDDNAMKDNAESLKTDSIVDSITTSLDIRPPADVLYNHLEVFFPQADLDSLIINDQLENAGGFGRMKSIRNIAQEASLRVARSSGAVRIPQIEEEKPKKNIQTRGKNQFLNSNSMLLKSNSTLLRRKSTKMWGQRVREVKLSSLNENGRKVIPRCLNNGHIKEFVWIKGELLGIGKFGKVYVAMNVTTGDLIAVKQMTINQKFLNRKETDDLVDTFKAEVDSLKDLDHINIVQYLGFEIKDQTYSIFLEYVSGGSIGHLLRKYGRFEESLVRYLTIQALEGLNYIHSKGILHRDLKADNLLLESNGILKISDFGISKRAKDIYTSQSKLNFQGTIFWMAPEIINDTNGTGYNAKVDIWALGCVVLEMFTGERPWAKYEGEGVLYKIGRLKETPPIKKEVRKEMSSYSKDFLARCFEIDAMRRPTAQTLLVNSFCTLDTEFDFATTKLGRMINEVEHKENINLNRRMQSMARKM
jgi:hypothetical protein